MACHTRILTGVTRGELPVANDETAKSLFEGSRSHGGTAAAQPVEQVNRPHDIAIVSVKRGVANSYVGLALYRPSGTVFGSFCHFDSEVRDIAPQETVFLREVVPMFVPCLE